MMSFIVAHRAEYGVDPMCRGLPLAPSTYYEHTAPPSSTPAVSRKPRGDSFGLTPGS